MTDPILAVLTRARPGRESDMVDWYTDIHQHDVLRFRGSTSAQLFRWSNDQPQFDHREDFGWHLLALYDTFDPERWASEHLRYFGSPEFVVSKAVDCSRGMNEFVYWPLQARANRPDTPHRGCVVFEQMNPAKGQRAAFERWYNDVYLPAALRRPGVCSGGFFAFRARGQMLSFLPRHSHVAVYRTEDASALAAWKPLSALAQCALLDQGTLYVTHWEAVNDRLTRDAVEHPSAALLAAEEAARARVQAVGVYASPCDAAAAWELAALSREQRAARQVARTVEAG